MKRIFFLLIAILFCYSSSFSQEWNFGDKFHVEYKCGACKSKVYLNSVENQDGVVKVTYKVEQLKSKMFGLFYRHKNPQILLHGSNIALPCKGELLNSGDYFLCSDPMFFMGAHPKGTTKYYSIYFEGNIPAGINCIDIVDDSSISFSNVFIDNPDVTKTKYDTEDAIKELIDKSNDGICGIYETKISNNSGLRLACIKDDGKYSLLYLSGNKNGIWKLGDLKAEMTQSSTKGLFTVYWYNNEKQLTNDCVIVFDGVTMSVRTNRKYDNATYIKMYPNQSEGNNFVSSSGTGFFISKNYVVTNNHVVENCNNITITGVGSDKSKKYSAEIVVNDKTNDLAILKIKDSSSLSIPSIPYTIKYNLAEIGEDCFTLGYPLIKTMGEEIKLTNGIISSRSGFEGNISQYQISIPLQPGNSGGPLFDKNGNIVGIIQAKHLDTENVGYAIKSSYLRSLIELLPTPLNMPKKNILLGKSLSQKVSSVSDFICIIIVNN